MSDLRAISIPNFVKAGSPQGLRRSMLSNNARLSAYVQYFDIQFINEAGRSYWIAWYFEPIQNNDPIFEPKAGE